MVGELQYELLLAILWENACEPCSFGPREEPLFPFGRPLPPAPPQTQVLGVDKTQPPFWKVEVNVQSVYGGSEKLPPALFALGCGPDLGKVHSHTMPTDLRHICQPVFCDQCPILCSRARQPAREQTGIHGVRVREEEKKITAAPANARLFAELSVRDLNDSEGAC